MRFLADENCDFAVVRALRGAGHDVATVKDLAPGSTDDEVIRLALGERRTLLTEDKDFGQLVFASAVESPGVVYLRFPAGARQEIADAVLALVKRNADLARRFVVVQPGRIRITERA